MRYVRTTAPWQIPSGWTHDFDESYRLDGMHLVERSVGAYRLIVGDDDGVWKWWLYPRIEGLSIASGEASDMLGAIWCALDELARHLDPTDTEVTS